MATPRPAAVRYNDWREVPVAAPDAFEPTLPVSVILCDYQTPAATLARTLAALERQTYPRQLFEVVIVDDGSEPPLQGPFDTSLEIKIVRQERRGFGLARARNTGVKAAGSDILLFLDSDLMAEDDWIRAHARWHHAVSDALTIGFHACVDVQDIDAETVRRRQGSLRALFAGRPVEAPWVESHMKMTRDLTSRDDDPFRMAGGGNCGLSKAFYELLGGHDESFAGWGGEDVEFCYRAYTWGGLLIPARDAFAWHQGLRLPAAKWRGGEVQQAKAAHLVAHRRFRRARQGRIFTTPQYVVTIAHDGQPAERLFEAAAKILADREHDLVVILKTAADEDGFAWLREQLASDARVRFGVAGSSLEEYPTASFHIALSASVPFATNLVRRLRARLGRAATAGITLPDGSSVSITRTWALHRAHRSGRPVAEYGDAVALRRRDLWTVVPMRGAIDGRAVRARFWNRRSAGDWLRIAANSLVSPAGAWWFLTWFAQGIARALSKGAWSRRWRDAARRSLRGAGRGSGER